MSALLREVAEQLWDYPDVPCAVEVEQHGQTVVVTVTMTTSGPTEQVMQTLELIEELRYLAGLAQVRSFAERYDIDSGKLEQLLPKGRG